MMCGDLMDGSVENSRKGWGVFGTKNAHVHGCRLRYKLRCRNVRLPRVTDIRRVRDW